MTSAVNVAVFVNKLNHGNINYLSSHYLKLGQDKTLLINAVENAHYQVVDGDSGFAIDDIATERINNDLRLTIANMELGQQGEIVIQNYFLHSGAVDGLPNVNSIVVPSEQTGVTDSIVANISAEQLTMEPIETVGAADILAEDSWMSDNAVLASLGGLLGAGVLSVFALGGGGGDSSSNHSSSTNHSNTHLNADYALPEINENSLSDPALGFKTPEPFWEQNLGKEQGVLDGIAVDPAKTSNVERDSTNHGSPSHGAGNDAGDASGGGGSGSNNPQPPAVLENRVSDSGVPYTVKMHPEYGRYLDASDFGTDPTGKSDSLPAIKAALAEANKLGIGVHLSGNLYISDQIVLDNSNEKVTALFGDGNGKIGGTQDPIAGQSAPRTLITFHKQQDWLDIYNSNTNMTNIDAYAGILVKNQNKKIIGDLSIQYLHKKPEDFYRHYENNNDNQPNVPDSQNSTYFGKVTGILVSDSDNITIQRVEALGANRSGIHFTSEQAYYDDPNFEGKKSYNDLLRSATINEHYSSLPIGENNKVLNSYLHNNRSAGLSFGFQKNFVAEGNRAEYNGHEKDGGTGYGIAAIAGTYNYGIKFLNNVTRGNYRKGLDVHDGNHIVIDGNVSDGDRLYGISVYNRHYTMDDVTITNNKVTQNKNFTLGLDDDGPGRAATARSDYYSYTAIQIASNYNAVNLHSDKVSKGGKYVIKDNVISGLDIVNTPYKTATYGIEFHNFEPTLNYKLDIDGNKIVNSKAATYLIGIQNDTGAVSTKIGSESVKGLGSGIINIKNNSANIDEVVGGVPVFVTEQGNRVQDPSTIGLERKFWKWQLDVGNPMETRGAVNVENNTLLITKNSNGWADGIQLVGNAETYSIKNNVLQLGHSVDKDVFSVLGQGKTPSDLTWENNSVFSGEKIPQGYVDSFRNVTEKSANNVTGLLSEMPNYSSLFSADAIRHTLQIDNNYSVLGNQSSAALDIRNNELLL